MQEEFAGREKLIRMNRRPALPEFPRFSDGATSSPLARLVAVLVVALVVGSMLLVFTTIKHEQTASPAQVRQPQKTQAPQLFCPTDTSDLGLPAICMLHETQPINQSKPFGTKHTLTLQAGYADANRVIIWYRLTPPYVSKPVTAPDIPSQALPPQPELVYGTLTTAQGVQVSGGMGGSTWSTSTQILDSYMIFDATSVPASVQTLKLHLVMTVLNTSSHPSYHASYDFSVPMQKSLRIDTNQTVTVSGMLVTLQRVVVSPSEVRFFMASPVLHSFGANTDDENYKLTTSNQAWNKQYHMFFGTNLDGRNGLHMYQLDLYESIMNAKGMWTLTISKNERKGATADWVFHFRVE
jgi:hypothetical protein